MPGALGNHVSQKRFADQRQVADQIEGLVPAAFIYITKPAWIKYAAAIKANRIVQRCAANQSHVAHLVELVLESERPRRGDLRRVTLGCHFHFDGLPVYHGMLEPNFARQTERLVREDSNALAAILYRYRTPYPKVSSLAPIVPGTRRLNQVHEWQPATIQNRNLQVIDLDESIIDTHTVENAEQMLRG